MCTPPYTSPPPADASRLPPSHPPAPSSPVCRPTCVHEQVGPKASDGPSFSYAAQLALGVNAKLGGATTRPAGRPKVHVRMRDSC